MEDNLIQLPMPDDARKPAEAFLNGRELGARLRKVFWLAERAWWEDLAPLGDGLSDDTFCKRLSTEIASLMHWMGKKNSFSVEDVTRLREVLSACATALREFLDPPLPPRPPSSVVALAPEDDEFSDSYVPRETSPQKMAEPAASPELVPNPQAQRLRELQAFSDDPEITAKATPIFNTKSPFLLQALRQKLPTAVERCCIGTPLQWNGYLCGFICGSACEPFNYLPREAAMGKSEFPMVVLLSETIDALLAMSPDTRLTELRKHIRSDTPDDWAYFEEIGDRARKIVSSMLEQGVQAEVKTRAFGLQLIAKTGTVRRKRFDSSVTLNPDYVALLDEIASPDDAILSYEALSPRFRGMRTSGGSPDADLNDYIKRINEKLRQFNLKIKRVDRSFKLCDTSPSTANTRRRTHKLKGPRRNHQRKQI